MSTLKRIGTSPSAIETIAMRFREFQDAAIKGKGHALDCLSDSITQAQDMSARAVELHDKLVEALEVVVARVRLEKEDKPRERVMLGAVVEEFAALIERAKAE